MSESQTMQSSCTHTRRATDMFTWTCTHWYTTCAKLICAELCAYQFECHSVQGSFDKRLGHLRLTRRVQTPAVHINKTTAIITDPPTSFISTWTCFKPPNTSSRSVTTCLIWSLTRSCLVLCFATSDSCRRSSSLVVGFDGSGLVMPEGGRQGPFCLPCFKFFCGTSVGKKALWEPPRPLQRSSDPPFSLPRSWWLSLSSPPSKNTGLCPLWPFDMCKRPRWGSCDSKW